MYPAQVSFPTLSSSLPDLVGFGADPLLAASQEGSSNDLGEVVQGMSSEECTSLWSGLKNIIPDTLADATPVSGPSYDA